MDAQVPRRRPPARLEAARRRARGAKTALVAVAVAAFATAGIAVRSAHSGGKASGSSSASSLSPPSDLVAALNQGSNEESFGTGVVAPAQSTPATATSTS